MTTTTKRLFSIQVGKRYEISQTNYSLVFYAESMSCHEK